VRAFWTAKIAGNRERDSRVLAKLSTKGWKTLVIWECMLRGPARRPLEEVLDRVADWLRRDPTEIRIANTDGALPRRRVVERLVQ